VCDAVAPALGGARVVAQKRDELAATPLSLRIDVDRITRLSGIFGRRNAVSIRNAKEDRMNPASLGYILLCTALGASASASERYDLVNFSLRV